MKKKQNSLHLLAFQAADILYAARKARRAKPIGRSDSAGRWFPSDEEDADNFTLLIRTPSRAWPHSYWKAACSRTHCRDLAVVRPRMVIDMAAKLDSAFADEVKAFEAIEAQRAEDNAKRRERYAERKEAALSATLVAAFPSPYAL